MNEHDRSEGDIDPMVIQYHVSEKPVKNLDGAPVDEAVLAQQAEAARDSIVTVDYQDVRGTCSDERERVGLLSGEAIVEARPSVWGGPNIYALYLAELTGFFGNKNDDTGRQRLERVTALINAAGLQSGGHKSCAANGGVPMVLHYIGDETNFAVLEAAAQTRLTNQYDKDTLQRVITLARVADNSQRYTNWDETILEAVLGNEAGAALEILADIPHDATDRIWNNLNGLTVSQNKLYETAHRRSFVFDNVYAEAIENVLASRPDSINVQSLLRHACMALDRAIIEAVPNRQISDITLTE